MWSLQREAQEIRNTSQTGTKRQRVHHLPVQVRKHEADHETDGKSKHKTDRDTNDESEHETDHSSGNNAKYEPGNKSDHGSGNKTDGIAVC